MDQLPEKFLKALQPSFAGQSLTVLAWSKTSLTGEDADAYWTIISRNSGKPNQYDEYMPHEVTISHVTRLIIFAPDGRVLMSQIISQDKEAYVQGTPDKIKPEPDPFGGRRKLW